MYLLKHIMLWSVLASFLINPAIACCSNGACLMSHEDKQAGAQPSAKGHGCDKMQQATQTSSNKATVQNNIIQKSTEVASVVGLASAMLDCSGCVDCDTFDQQAHPTGLKSVSLKSIDLEKIILQPLVDHSLHISLMMARKIPPSTAPPPPRPSPVAEKTRLLL